MKVLKFVKNQSIAKNRHEQSYLSCQFLCRADSCDNFGWLNVWKTVETAILGAPFMLRVRYEGSQRIQLGVCYDIGNVKICQISVLWLINAFYVIFLFKCCNFLIFYTFWTVFSPFSGNFWGKNDFLPMHGKFFHVPQDPLPRLGWFSTPPPSWISFLIFQTQLRVH